MAFESMQNLKTPSGEQHGWINTYPNSVPPRNPKDLDEKHRTELEKQRKEDAKPVKARYINHKNKQGKLEKAYVRWAGDPIMIWKFLHNHEYEVPYGLVKEVNDPTTRPKKRSELLDPNTGRITEKDEQDIEHEFVPTGF